MLCLIIVTFHCLQTHIYYIMYRSAAVEYAQWHCKERANRMQNNKLDWLFRRNLQIPLQIYKISLNDQTIYQKKKIVILKKISRMLKIASISGDMQRCGDCLAQKKRLVYVLTINLWTKLKQITDIIPFIVVTPTYPRAPLCRWHLWWCNTKTTKIIQKQQSWLRVHKSVQEWRGDTRTVVITS